MTSGKAVNYKLGMRFCDRLTSREQSRSPNRSLIEGPRTSGLPCIMLLRIELANSTGSCHIHLCGAFHLRLPFQASFESGSYSLALSCLNR